VGQKRANIVAIDVRFGSKADMCAARRHVRFSPNSDQESGFPEKSHSASRVERLLMTLALGVWAFDGQIDNLDFGCF
jgi:hypothetical protein